MNQVVRKSAAQPARKAPAKTAAKNKAKTTAKTTARASAGPHKKPGAGPSSRPGAESRAGSTRTRQATGDGRDRILEAALEEFAVHGFIGASLRHIARRADVQHQLIVHHFKTKEALWKAVVGEQLTVTVEVGRRIAELDQRQGPTHALLLLVRAYVDWAASNPAFHRLVAYETSSDSPRLQWLVRNYYQVLFDVTTGLIERSQKLGECRPGPPRQLYFALTGIITSRFLHSSHYQLITSKDPFSPAEVESVYRFALDFLGLSPNQG
jgi:TetR/AcrR family transcriptional regulator